MARLNLTTTMWPNTVTGNALDRPAVMRADIDSSLEFAWMRTWEQTGLLTMQNLNCDGQNQYFKEPKFLADADKALSDTQADAANHPALEQAVTDATATWVPILPLHPFSTEAGAPKSANCCWLGKKSWT